MTSSPAETSPSPSVLDAALAWQAAGCSVVPIALDGSKRPLGQWKEWQRTRMTPEQVRRTFADGHAGVGLVCGAVSGGLEMLEFEGVAVAERLPERVRERMVSAGLSEVWGRVTGTYRETTPGGGDHYLYRVVGGQVPGNTKLASRPATTGELAADPSTVKVLAETRGEGGMSIVAPSHGVVHPSGRAWQLETGRAGVVARITWQERVDLHRVLASFDLRPVAPPSTPLHLLGTTDGDVKPGDDYNARGAFPELLERHGWTAVQRQGDVTQWRRPGKNVGISASTGYGEGNWLWVWSTSTPFNAEQTYTLFGAYTVLEHAGDHSAAARALRAAGYGRARTASTSAGTVDLATGEVVGGRQEGGAGGKQSTVLLGLARERYTFGRSTEDEYYAASVETPHIAQTMRGGKKSLRADLAFHYATKTGQAPSANAVSETMMVLEGEAMREPATPLALRCHQDGDDRIVIDLGRADGGCAVVTPEGWSVDPAPAGVTFRRTGLTGEMVLPSRDGDLQALRRLLNVTAETWPLLVGWMASAFMPNIAHAIALLTGEQGTGKTTVGRMLVELLDPSGAPLRSSPKDERDWAVAASSSHVVAVDNISSISQWFSDALCRAVTGDGAITRRLYSDGDVSVLQFRRVVLLTSIDPGGLRGDLANRLLTVELERIDASGRRTEQVLQAEWQRSKGAVLGGLLDLLAGVLAALPEARRTLTERGRMADFHEVLAAVDIVLGTQATYLYEQAAERLAADVVLGDPVAAAVLALMERDHGFDGSMQQLLQALRLHAPDPLPRTWPVDATRLSGALKRATPGLRSMGVAVEQKRTSVGARVALSSRPEVTS